MTDQEKIEAIATELRRQNLQHFGLMQSWNSAKEDAKSIITILTPTHISVSDDQLRASTAEADRLYPPVQDGD